MRFGVIIWVILVVANNLGVSLALTTSKIKHFPAIFNFGDSNSDTGGLTAVYGQAPPPNGETFFGGSAGRFCDGRLVIDFLGTPFIFILFYYQLVLII